MAVEMHAGGRTTTNRMSYKTGQSPLPWLQPKNSLMKSILKTSLLLALAGSLYAGQATITVHADKPGEPSSPLLHGIFFEEIHRAGEGGVLAQMVMNPSFEDNATGWKLQLPSGAKAMMTPDKKVTLNERNPTTLRLKVDNSGGGRVGVFNSGFWVPVKEKKWDGWSNWFYSDGKSRFSGFNVEKGAGYRYSLYLKSEKPLSKPLSISLEKSDGTVLASAELSGVDASWNKLEGELTAAESDPNARLVVSTTETGTLWLDMVTLYPKETFNGTPFRKDLMQLMADMKPKFFRFPGGTFIQGTSYENAFHWKETIGDPAQRVPRVGFWGYKVDRTLGFHEYLLMAKALGAEPLFCCYAGIGPGVTVPMENMDVLVQDALDAIEYANGDAKTTKWGAERAKNGHPEPFNMKLIEIGNENFRKEYRDRYLLFYKAIKAKYPEMTIITCEGALAGGPAPVEMMDKHEYESPDWLVAHADKYSTEIAKIKIDNYAWLEANPEMGNLGGARMGEARGQLPGGAKIFVGEFAAVFNCGMGNVQAAVAEAAFLTGLENVPKMVSMAAYAPYFTNSAWMGWWPAAMVFDSAKSYGTASYQMLKMFSRNQADERLEAEVKSPEVDYTYPSGTIGIGIRHGGVAEFKEIEVSHDGKSVYQFDPSKGLEGWVTGPGTWEIVDGAIRVTDEPYFYDPTFTAMLAGKEWKNMTLKMKVRRVSGDTPINIHFNANNPKRINGWALGAEDSKTKVKNSVHGVYWHWHPKKWEANGGLENGRWYDVKVEVQDGKIRCYLDGQQRIDTAYPLVKTPALLATVGRDKKAGETVLKVVNVSDKPMDTRIKLSGAQSAPLSGSVSVLTSESAGDVNTFDHPLKVAPKTTALEVKGPSFNHVFPANSVTILRVR